MPASPRRSRPGFRPRPSRVALALGCAVLLLVGCGPSGGEDDDRQFASETRPVRVVSDATATRAASPVAPDAGGERPPIAFTPDPARLLRPTTPQPATFRLIDGRLLIVGTDGAIARPEIAGQPIALSVSPDGAAAAVLLARGPGAATPVTGGTSPSGTPPPGTPAPTAADADAVTVIGPDGVVLRQVTDLDAIVAAAVAGGADGDRGVVTVALGITAGDLLLVLGDGLLISVPLDGPPVAISGSGNFSEVRQVSWAPGGGALAIVAATESGGPPALFYSPLRADGIDPVRVAPGDGRSTGPIVWLPDGSAVLYTEIIDQPGPAAAAGGDLFRTPLRSDQRSLVVAAGVIGPSSGVGEFAVSADGWVCAFTLNRLDGGRLAFNSLWVTSLNDRQQVRVALPAGVIPVGIVWADVGLVVLVSGPDGAVSGLIVGRDGVAIPAGAPAATPEAMPAATPVA